MQAEVRIISVSTWPCRRVSFLTSLWEQQLTDCRAGSYSSQPAVDSMVLELRIYTIKEGMMDEFVSLFTKHIIPTSGSTVVWKPA